MCGVAVAWFWSTTTITTVVTHRVAIERRIKPDMRAFRNTQLRRDILQNCLSITQSSNGNNAAAPAAGMEVSPSCTVNPDLADDSLFNSAFHSAHARPEQPPQRFLVHDSTFYSQAQLDRMKNYMGKLPLQREWIR